MLNLYDVEQLPELRRADLLREVAQATLARQATQTRSAKRAVSYRDQVALALIALALRLAPSTRDLLVSDRLIARARS